MSDLIIVAVCAIGFSVLVGVAIYIHDRKDKEKYY